MSIKSFIRPLALLMALVAAVTINAQAVRIVKTAGDEIKNPTVFFRGVTGDKTVSDTVGNDLFLCGWYDKATSPDNADFVISGSCNGSALVLNVASSGGKTTLFNVTKPLGSDRTHGVHQAIDMVLNQQFKVPGICASRIAFSVKTSERAKNVYVSDFSGRNMKILTKHNNLVVEPDWFPNCRSVLYTMYTGSRTEVIQTELNPYRSRILICMPGLNTGAAISPNGQYMALILSRDKLVELYVKSVNSSSMHRLTNGRAVEASPCWSPDGSQLCFVSDMGGSPRLYVMSAGGGSPTRLPTQGSESVSPSWAKNGSIAYAAKMGRNYAIAVISKDPKVESGVITNAAGDWESPSWAPDNRHLVCSVRQGNYSTLYVVDTWTKRTRKMFASNLDMTFPSWSNLY